LAATQALQGRYILPNGSGLLRRAMVFLDLTLLEGRNNSHVMHSGITDPFWRERKEKQRQKEIEKLVARQIAENKRNGLHQKFHPNGRLFREWTVVNGKQEGLFREWNENGVLIIEKPMKRGLANGTVKQWSSKGKFLGEYKMKMGKGIIRKWNDDGSLTTEAEFVNKTTLRVKIYGDPKKKFHEAFLWNARPISKKKFSELLKGKAGKPKPRVPIH
jgi:antitoxin component YwqK of YwqJK toxin-antitoxin module